VGALTEGNILTQLKKGQGETNTRLDALIAEQRRTNQLLAELAGRPPEPGIAKETTYGTASHRA
jgi:hypothetical protein